MEWHFSKVFCFGPAFALTGAVGSFAVDFSVNIIKIWKTQQSPVAIRSGCVLEAVFCLRKEGRI